MKRYLQSFDNCLEKEKPYCSGACPFNMDVKDFIEKMQRSAFTAAYKVYRNSTGFPRIASSLCDEPCKNVCPREKNGGSLEMRLLEEASIIHTDNTAATDYNIPAKKERIAIIGAGIAGMAALLRLSTKKYEVEVFEKTERWGGSLRNILDDDIYSTDFEEQLAHQEYNIHYNTEITNLDQLDSFDAIFVATGKDGKDFGLLSITSPKGDAFCMLHNGTGCFAGGELIGEKPLYALAGGLNMGTVIDNYLKTKNLLYPRGTKPSAMCDIQIDINAKNTDAAVIPADSIYSKAEAATEAGRCLLCQCDACRIKCDLLEFTDKWPLKIKDEILATTLEGKTELKATPARRLMSMCNQCGICKEVCPSDIDLDGLFIEGRRKMHAQGKMPWPFHDFWLRDMEQANSQEASLIRRPVSDISEYALFPGCQLGASEPEIVVKLYDALLNSNSDTGMFLRCCGVPLLWAGDMDGFNSALNEIRTSWTSMGEPVMIMACMTCMKHFKEYLPDIPVISLYELLQSREISGGCCEDEYAVFDPCSARKEADTRAAVRDLASELGVNIKPLDDNNEYFTCCGYGGHGSIANPQYADYVADKRIAESDTPYITYCINCRDIFLKRGKSAKHILEFIFGDGEGQEMLASVTKRQENRRELKEALLSFFWDESTCVKKQSPNIVVEMDEAVRKKLDRERILEDEVFETIDFCQRHKRTIRNDETGTLAGYHTIGYATYWVEYLVLDEEKKKYRLVNAYTHRIKIELEAVWNGIRQDLELQ